LFTTPLDIKLKWDGIKNIKILAFTVLWT